MKEYPILFSGPMVKAILQGRKTQTRRVMKVQPSDNFLPVVGFYHPTLVDRDGEQYPGEETYGASDEYENYPCPYGQPGGTLWVRETWQAQNLDRKWWHEVKREDRSVMNWAWTNPVERAYLPMPPRWLPSIHMPRIACRITLQVKKVRVERLQGIGERDAIAEGIDEWAEMFRCGPDSDPCWTRDAVLAYKWLWNSINAKRGYGWDVNPWVWVIEFETLPTN